MANNLNVVQQQQMKPPHSKGAANLLAGTRGASWTGCVSIQGAEEW